MYLKTLEKNVLKYTNLILLIFLSASWLAWQVCLKKTRIKLVLLPDFDSLLMLEKRIRGGICYVIHRCAKASNKYMKNYDKNKESSYIRYLDANNLCSWAMSQKLPVNGLEWVKDISRLNKKRKKFIKLIKTMMKSHNHSWK